MLYSKNAVLVKIYIVAVYVTKFCKLDQAKIKVFLK